MFYKNQAKIYGLIKVNIFFERKPNYIKNRLNVFIVVFKRINKIKIN